MSKSKFVPSYKLPESEVTGNFVRMTDKPDKEDDEIHDLSEPELFAQFILQGILF
jgi:hypothetical protein